VRASTRAPRDPEPPAERSDDAVEERTQDSRQHADDVGPEVGLGTAGSPLNCGKVDHERAVEQIGSRREIVDPVEDDRSLRVEDRLGVVRIELARREPAARREPTESVRDPGLHTR
jgi:hypothetical protein